MNAFVIAAVALLVSVIPAGVVLLRGRAMEALVAFEFVSTVAVMIFVLLAEGFGRPGEFELPVLVAVLLYGSGLVFARFLERGVSDEADRG